MKKTMSDYSKVKQARLEMMAKHIACQIEEFVSNDEENINLVTNYELISVILIPVFIGLTSREIVATGDIPVEGKIITFEQMADGFSTNLKASFEQILIKFNEINGHK